MRGKPPSGHTRSHSNGREPEVMFSDLHRDSVRLTAANNAAQKQADLLTAVIDTGPVDDQVDLSSALDRGEGFEPNPGRAHIEHGPMLPRVPPRVRREPVDHPTGHLESLAVAPVVFS